MTIPFRLHVNPRFADGNEAPGVPFFPERRAAAPVVDGCTVMVDEKRAPPAGAVPALPFMQGGVATMRRAAASGEGKPPPVPGDSRAAAIGGEGATDLAIRRRPIGRDLLAVASGAPPA